jgi:hypothetical protein
MSQQDVMLKDDLYPFVDGLELSTFDDPIVTYAVNKNLRLAKTEIKDMEKSVEPDEKMQKFIDERKELAEKHCKRDDDGNFLFKKVVDPNGKEGLGYDIIGQGDEKGPYRKALATLEKKYKDAIDKHETKEEKFRDKLLKEEADINIHCIELEYLKENEIKVPQNIMNCIFWMITDPKEVKKKK